MGLRGTLWNELACKTRERQKYYDRYVAVGAEITSLKERLSQHSADREGLEEEVRRLGGKQEALALLIFEENREIGRVLINQNLGTMVKNVERILASTRRKTDDLSSRVEALVQKQVNLQGVQEWLGNLGRHKNKCSLEGGKKAGTLYPTVEPQRTPRR
jgi:chromosome segregation ATPase